VVRPRRLEARIPTQPDVMAEARYRLRVVFPRPGRWSYTLLAGTPERRRFLFPDATVGGNAERVTDGVAAFPEGSPEAAPGAGGRGDSLPPEVVPPATSAGDGGGLPLWIPAAGLALAGAGTLTLMRRRGHR
jgi:MYXO-CTERM domain-containing protein